MDYFLKTEPVFYELPMVTYTTRGNQVYMPAKALKLPKRYDTHFEIIQIGFPNHMYIQVMGISFNLLQITRTRI